MSTSNTPPPAAPTSPQQIQNQGQASVSTVPATNPPTSQARPIFPTRMMVLDSAAEAPPPNAQILNEQKKK